MVHKSDDTDSLHRAKAISGRWDAGNGRSESEKKSLPSGKTMPFAFCLEDHFHSTASQFVRIAATWPAKKAAEIAEIKYRIGRVIVILTMWWSLV